MFNSSALSHSELSIANIGVPVRLRSNYIVDGVELRQLFMALRRLRCLDSDLHSVKE